MNPQVQTDSASNVIKTGEAKLEWTGRTNMVPPSYFTWLKCETNNNKRNKIKKIFSFNNGEPNSSTTLPAFTGSNNFEQEPGVLDRGR